MHADDAPHVTQLLPDLGYSATVPDIQERLATLMARPEQGIFVAEQGGVIVGLSHVYGVRLLASYGFAEVGELVVALPFQRKGVGRLLMYAVESWASQHAYARVRLRSGIHREDAHQFYERLGYERSRASFAFERRLPIPTNRSP